MGTCCDKPNVQEKIPRKVKSKRKSILKTIEMDDDSTEIKCCICLDAENLDGKLRSLDCKHQFHDKCIDAWFAK